MLPLLDWNRDSAENGWGAACVVLALDTAGGGKGVANIDGGIVEYVTAVECIGIDATEPGGGVGLVNEFVAGDNCALLVLNVEWERETKATYEYVILQIVDSLFI